MSEDRARRQLDQPIRTVLGEAAQHKGAQSLCRAGLCNGVVDRVQRSNALGSDAPRQDWTCMIDER